jgi:hypothetical protein
MHNSEWITVFRQLPQELYQQTVLVLNNRMELTIETLLRIEPTFLAVRGRMGGTTEGGLMFLVPYDQLTAIYMFKTMTETEVEAMFGPPKSASQLTSRSHLAIRAPSATNVQPAPAPAPAPAPPPAPMPAAATMVPAFGRPPEATAVARNNLLERLRAARQAAMPNAK